MSGQSRGLVGDYDSGEGHGILYIVNLAKIMEWLWYEDGQEDGHEFGPDYGQDIYNIIFHGHDNFHSYGYRLFPARRKDFLRGQFQFLMAGFAQKWKVEKNKKN